MGSRACGKAMDGCVHICKILVKESKLSTTQSSHHEIRITHHLVSHPPSLPPCTPSPSHPIPSHPLLLPPTQIPPTKRLRPPPRRLLLLPQPLQPLRIQSRIPPLGPIHTLLARQIAHAAEYAAGGEGAADAFGDAALDCVDVFVAGEVGG